MLKFSGFGITIYGLSLIRLHQGRTISIHSLHFQENMNKYKSSVTTAAVSQAG